MTSSKDDWIEMDLGATAAQFKLLIVDDSVFVRKQVIEILKNRSVVVLEAEDGLSGLDILTKNPDIKLVLCDVNMPKMDGFALLERLAQGQSDDKPRIPVIMLTNENKLDKVIEGKKFGATAWITKPPQPQDIIALVEKYGAK